MLSSKEVRSQLISYLISQRVACCHVLLKPCSSVFFNFRCENWKFRFKRRRDVEELLQPPPPPSTELACSLLGVGPSPGAFIREPDEPVQVDLAADGC